MPGLDHKPSITVLTATHNRAHTLRGVYESLRAQTFRDFEWVIVDDGSLDGTQELVKKWQAESTFPICYFWQENRGYHVALNIGIKKARGALLVQLDSDDSCLPQALARLKFHWDSIPQQARSGFVGVCCLCLDQSGRLVGDRFPKDILDSDHLRITFKYKVRGGKWALLRTDVLREFPFPQPQGVRFVCEGMAWRAIARRYKTRFVNEALYIYNMDDRPASNRLCIAMPQSFAPGMALNHASVLNSDMDYFLFAPIQFLRSAVHYVRFSLHCDIGFADQLGSLHNTWAKGLWVVAAPLGVLVYWRDRRKQRAAEKCAE